MTADKCDWCHRDDDRVFRSGPFLLCASCLIKREKRA